jgi:hypothetical protein
MHYFIYKLWFVFLVVVIQTQRRWIIFKTFKINTLSSSSSKASEPLINSAYYSFLALFTIYAMHEIMNSSMITLLYHCTRCWFAYG